MQRPYTRISGGGIRKNNSKKPRKMHNYRQCCAKDTTFLSCLPGRRSERPKFRARIFAEVISILDRAAYNQSIIVLDAQFIRRSKFDLYLRLSFSSRTFSRDLAYQRQRAFWVTLRGLSPQAGNSPPCCQSRPLPGHCSPMRSLARTSTTRRHSCSLPPPDQRGPVGITAMACPV